MHYMYISNAIKPERSTHEHNETEDKNKQILENARRRKI